jgi:FMN phosphatase YigB (HAD superfamily)
LEEGALPIDGSSRLKSARRRIETGAVSVVTLDMFDTIVWRTVPRPTDAFVLLATRLEDEGVLVAGVDPMAFRRLRTEAERCARTLKESGGDGSEVTLDEIWDQFPPPLLLRDMDVAARLEVDLEVAITRPDLDVIAFAEFAAEHDCRLAVVSNTYLSAEDLARILDGCGAGVLRDVRIFASSAFGVSKANGLWKIVLDEIDVPPERVLHVGDELTSDVVVPSEHGVHTVHLPKTDAPTDLVFRRERAVPAEHLPPRPHALDVRRGDYGLTGLRAKVGIRAGSIDLPAEHVTAWHYGATVLGPVLTGFADWVSREAERLGVRSIRCMMREGEFLADLVGRAGTGRDATIPAVPVWLSRAVTAKAIISEADATELAGLLNRRLVPTVREYVTNLGLRMGEVPALRSAASERMDQPHLAREVIESLIDSDHLRTRIVAESTATRARLLDYLRPLLLEDGPTTLLVDLGWGATIQWQLRRALQLAGIDHNLVGLYLATNSAAIPRALQGLDVRGYLANFGEPYEAIEQIGRSPEIIEQACLATCGSLTDFTPDGQAVLDSSMPPPDQVTSKTAVQHGVRAFQREWLRYGAALPVRPGLDGGERAHLVEILYRSVVQPTAEEARTFGTWSHDDNFGVNQREEVIAPRLGAYAPYLSPPDLAEMTMHEAFWPLGVAAQYDPSLAAATQLVLSGALRADDFGPGRDPLQVRVAADTGAGWDHWQHRPLRFNRNGLSYARFDIRAEGIVSVRFDPCDHPAMFRIDWIELGLRLRGSGEPERVRIEGPDALGSLVYSGCRWLYDGVGIGVGDHCEIHIPMHQWTPREVYGVEVTVAMAVLPLPRSAGEVGLSRSDFGTSLSWALGKVRAEATNGGVRAVGRGAVRFARRRIG